MKFFKPDYELKHFSDVSLSLLKDQNIQAIFSDLDSTLAAHDQLGNHEFSSWYKQLNNNGIKLIVVSNNSQDRVERFTKPYNILGYGKCSKPSVSKIKKIMDEVGVTNENSLFLGDQLFTDVLCGKRLGMKTVLVHPLGEEHEPWIVRWKRGLEASIKKRW